MDLIYKNTPLDLVIKILEYNGSIKFRNGKFIDQINKDDYRYKILHNISPIEPINYFNTTIYFRRPLGKYYVNLKIDTFYEMPIYRYIFQRKREENDYSRIILYYHELT